MKILFVTLFATTLFSFNAQSEEYIYGSTTIFKEDINCYTDSLGEVRWKYCIVKTQGSQNPDVMYNFHGLANSENEWMNKDRNIAIRSHWKKNKIEAPVVVTISFGRVWLLAEQNASEHSGLYELFRDYVYQKIESRLSEYTGRRILMGASMGGFNASQILLKNPEMFDSYVLACPIMTDVSLYASDEELKEFQKENNADFVRLLTMVGIARRYYPDEESFNKAWQIKLAETALSPLTPPFHISCGQLDEYGIHNSVMHFKDIAISKGAPVTWESLKGDHCVLNPIDVGNFITRK